MRENLLVIDPDKLACKKGCPRLPLVRRLLVWLAFFLEEGVSFARESTLTAKF